MDPLSMPYWICALLTGVELFICLGAMWWKGEKITVSMIIVGLVVTFAPGLNTVMWLIGLVVLIMAAMLWADENIQLPVRRK